MKSDLPKVLYPLAGRPMLGHVIDLARSAARGKIIVVVGHRSGDVMSAFSREKGLTFVIQRRQFGTAHAVLTARKALPASGTILILNGDAPLVQPDSIKALLFLHKKIRSQVTVLTAVMPRPKGYGRIIRRNGTEILRVVEEKDATADELRVREVNGGIYAVEAGFLLPALKRIQRENAQREYYLPDIVRIAREQGKRSAGLIVDDPREIMGINTRIDLAGAAEVMRGRILEAHMLNGVTVVDPRSAWVDAGVRIGRDTAISPGAVLQGTTAVGRGCVLGPGCVITDSTVGDGAVVKAYSVVEGARLGQGTSVGPFAHLRPGAVLEDTARVGNFVEVKKSRIGRGSKAMHLTYLGDATLGRNVNIGAGTVTCNYDGFKKSKTVIGDRVLIGSDTMLVAPVRVGPGAVTGAGSTITKNIPGGALAVARSRQANILGYRKKMEASAGTKRGQKKKGQSPFGDSP